MELLNVKLVIRALTTGLRRAEKSYRRLINTNSSWPSPVLK